MKTTIDRKRVTSHSFRLIFQRSLRENGILFDARKYEFHFALSKTPFKENKSENGNSDRVLETKYQASSHAVREKI